MIELTHRAAPGTSVNANAVLTIHQRVRSRQRIKLSDGREAGLFVGRGETLRGGDLLTDATGIVVEVVAANERVSTVSADSGLLLARVCYHLGNRHVPLEVGVNYARYLHDHVLDDMVRGLGATIVVHDHPFEPEDGAYGGTSHSHAHSHEH
ncbi:urease accessory protein UreE [Litorivicinus lipolyticus]|uniref:Urease accessory protein UreE n=1 Tax=Litorivicinus lipolyticus TaxID=418701 RepID=A0A5Q2QBD9_9GAMM|nr:urease accessory protein UreE [Litorivicinus lipolyticus]QGG79592.1 urease accessory protein UreE [Litorivicinus lipolyticus]